MRFSLNVKVLFFFFLSVASVITIISYIFINSYKQTLIQRTTANLSLIRDTKKEEIETFLQERRSDIKVLANSYGVRTMMQALSHE